MSTQILDAGQEAYKNFNAFSNFAGSLTIVDGCQDSSGGTVTNGFVSIYGELLPFVGTTVTASVVIIEVPDSRGFEDGSVKPVIYTRYATFGSGVIEYPWADFRRPMTLFQLEDRLLQLEKAVPIGLVAVWGLPLSAIPIGWVEHTDLVGTVPVGHKVGDVNFGALDGLIGTAQVTLDITQIPALNFGWTGLDGTGYPDDSAGNTGAGAPYSYVRRTQNLTKGGGHRIPIFNLPEL